MRLLETPVCYFRWHHSPWRGYGILVRFVDSEFSIQQQLVSMQLIAKSMSGEEIARELISTLSVDFSVPSNLLLAAMQDRAARNNVAIRTLQVIYPSLLDVGCFSHTLDLVGKKFNVIRFHYMVDKPIQPQP